MPQRERTMEVFDGSYANSFKMRAKRLIMVGRLLLATTLIIYLLRLPGIYRYDPHGFMNYLVGTYSVIVFLPLVLGLVFFSMWPIVCPFFIVFVLTYEQFAKVFGWHNHVLFAAIILLPIIAGFLGIAIFQAKKKATQFD